MKKSLVLVIFLFVIISSLMAGCFPLEGEGAEEALGATPQPSLQDLYGRVTDLDPRLTLGVDCVCKSLLSSERYQSISEESKKELIDKCMFISYEHLIDHEKGFSWPGPNRGDFESWWWGKDLLENANLYPEDFLNDDKKIRSTMELMKSCREEFIGD